VVVVVVVVVVAVAVDHRVAAALDLVELAAPRAPP
jgi:hypothetical protein